MENKTDSESTSTESTTETLESVLLPSVMDRLKATFTDVFVIILLMLFIANVFDSINDVPEHYRILGAIIMLTIYDPLCVSLTGGSVGHYAMGLRVKRISNQEKNISFPLAILRLIIKILLGWISLLTVPSSENKQAIHDHIVESIVIFKRK